MSEEKEARNILVNEIADILVGEYCKRCKICENEDIECYYGKAIDTIDELITKQQKEIEELKNNELDYTTIYIHGKLDGEKKYKDKIREKIKEVSNGIYDAKLILKDLLED